MNEDYKRIYNKIVDTLANAGFYGDELLEQAKVMSNAIYKQYLLEKKENELKGSKDE